MERICGASPFAVPIVPNNLTELHPRIRELAGTSWLVRTYELTKDPKYKQSMLTDHKEAISRWRQIRSYEGINVPSFSPVIGTQDGTNPALFIVTQKIDGENMETVTLSGDKLQYAQLFNGFLTGLINYSIDSFAMRGPYLSDQNLSQYVLGKTEYGQDAIYFIDFGLEHHILPETFGQHYENSYFFATYMQSIFMMLEQLEEKVGQPLIEARIKMTKFLNGITPGTGGVSYARSLSRLVLQSKFQTGV